MPVSPMFINYTKAARGWTSPYSRLPLGTGYRSLPLKEVSEMRVNVKLFATLVSFVPGSKAGVPFEFELPDDSTILDLMSQLSLPEREIKVAFVNGRVQPADFQLQHGYEVGIFPPIGGG